MALTAPTWLIDRGGSLELGPDRKTWFVIFNNKPNYALNAVPVAGKLGCAIRQTNNGQRVESTTTGSSVEDAIAGGLEDLRKALGWG